MASPSSLTSSTSVHHASLVDPALHSPLLLELINLKICKQVIEYLVGKVLDTVYHAMNKPVPPKESLDELARSNVFVTEVVTRAQVTMPTLLATIVYIDRVRPSLFIATGDWALERVFIGALVVASKYLHDATMKNVYWAICTGIFGRRDVGLMEREYLSVLDFDLRITEDNLLSHYAGLSGAISPSQIHGTLLVSPSVPSNSMSRNSEYVKNPGRRRPRRHRLVPCLPKNSTEYKKRRTGTFRSLPLRV